MKILHNLKKLKINLAGKKENINHHVLINQKKILIIKKKGNFNQ